MRKRLNQKASVQQGRWALYATAGAATALGGVSVAEGEIFYSGLIHLKFHPPRFHVSSTHIQLDKPGDSINPRLAETNSEAVYGLAEFRVSGVGGASVVGFRTFSYAGPFNFLSKLYRGINLSTQVFIPKSHSGGYSLLDYGAIRKSKWKEPGTAFVGFRFNDGTGWRYGWARIRKEREPSNFFELIDYAYGDVGEPVRAGQRYSHEQVPAEGSLGFLALGAAGLLFWRKNRARALPS
jgi:hypothetical protein